MRLWSIHPKYLDTKGLLAVWREGLLAKAVLESKTKGYINHPQLIRFRATMDPIAAINLYLDHVVTEAKNRNYNFDHSKLVVPPTSLLIPVTRGQVDFEHQHLITKLTLRDPKHLEKIVLPIEPHPIFEIIEGEIETWEKIK